MTICVTDWVESIVGKAENAGYHNVFIRLLFQGREKSGLYGIELRHRKHVWEKTENAYYKHFLLFQQFYQMPFYSLPQMINFYTGPN